MKVKKLKKSLREARESLKLNLVNEEVVEQATEEVAEAYLERAEKRKDRFNEEAAEWDESVSVMRRKRIYRGLRPRPWFEKVVTDGYKIVGAEVREERVREEASRDVQYAADFFNARVAEKILDVLPGTGHKVTANVRLDRGVFQGRVRAELDGNYAEWTVKLKRNYRYGSNSANGVITAYWQVPCRLVETDVTEDSTEEDTEERRVPETVEDVKTLDKLVDLLVNREKYEKRAAERRARRMVTGTQGPGPRITRYSNKLGLPNDLTAEEAVALLGRSK